jgi:hypothetical protein
LIEYIIATEYLGMRLTRAASMPGATQDRIPGNFRGVVVMSNTEELDGLAEHCRRLAQDHARNPATAEKLESLGQAFEQLNGLAVSLKREARAVERSLGFQLPMKAAKLKKRNTA